MASEKTPARKDREAISGFHKDQEKLVMERVNVILFLGWALVPFFGVIDYILYPQHFSRFILYRLIAAACCLILYHINSRRRLGFKSLHLGMAAFYIVGLAIILMVLKLADMQHPIMQD